MRVNDFLLIFNMDFWREIKFHGFVMKGYIIALYAEIFGFAGTIIQDIQPHDGLRTWIGVLSIISIIFGLILSATMTLRGIYQIIKERELIRGERLKNDKINKENNSDKN